MNIDNYFKYRLPYDKNREIVWKELAKYLQKFIPKTSKILELGAGYCEFINNIEGSEKHALDIYQEIKNFAKPGIITHISSCTKIKLDKDYFDIVFASNLLEHLNKEDIDKTLNEIYRILKKDGKLILIQPNFKFAYKEYFDDYTHQTTFTDISLNDLLLSKNFIILRLMPKFLPISLKSKLPKNSLLIKAYLHSPIKPFGKQMLIIAKK